MGFLSGGVTFLRFKVDGPKPRQFDDEHLGRLREYRAGTQRAVGADGVQTGWAAGKSVMDTDFTELKNVYPDHLAFDFWTEVNRLPPERLKAYYEADLMALTAANPSGYPSARQKREARESARDRLTEEAKDGRFKKWKCVPVLWDAIRNEVFFGATSAAAGERFTTLFAATFGANLVHGPALATGLKPVTAGSVALVRDKKAKHERLSPFVVGTTPDACSWVPGEDGPPDHLGNEFLLWLWHYAQERDDSLTTPDENEVTFMFAGGVRLECPAALTGNDTINHDSGVRTPEARAGLRTGKLPRKAALTVVRHGDQHSFKIDAETLAVTGGKLHKPDAEVRGREVDHIRGRTPAAEPVPVPESAS